METKRPHGATKRAGNTRTEPGQRETSGVHNRRDYLLQRKKGPAFSSPHTHAHTHCADRRTKERTEPLRRRAAVELKGMRKRELPRSQSANHLPRSFGLGQSPTSLGFIQIRDDVTSCKSPYFSPSEFTLSSPSFLPPGPQYSLYIVLCRAHPLSRVTAHPAARIHLLKEPVGEMNACCCVCSRHHS